MKQLLYEDIHAMQNALPAFGTWSIFTSKFAFVLVAKSTQLYSFHMRTRFKST